MYLPRWAVCFTHFRSSKRGKSRKQYFQFATGYRPPSYKSNILWSSKNKNRYREKKINLHLEPTKKSQFSNKNYFLLWRKGCLLLIWMKYWTQGKAVKFFQGSCWMRMEAERWVEMMCRTSASRKSQMFVLLFFLFTATQMIKGTCL